jgi:hypothetical protein
MITRRAVHRGLAWAGLVVGAAALLVYVLDLFCAFGLDTQNWTVYLGRGAVSIQWEFPPQYQASPTAPGVMLAVPRQSQGWIYERAGSRAWRWLPHWANPETATRNTGFSPGLFVIPLWIPMILGLWAGYSLLPAGLPARGKPRCPRCRFDLAGAPAVDVKHVQVQCPECGKLSQRDDIAIDRTPR